MPRGVDVQRTATVCGLLIVSVGCFVFGEAASALFKPLPVVAMAPMRPAAAQSLPAPAPPMAKPQATTAPAAVAIAPAVERVAQSPATPAPVLLPEPSPPAPAPALTVVTAPAAAQSRSLGFLTEIAGVAEAIGAVDTARGGTSAELDRLIPAVIEHRDDPKAWSELAASLAHAGQRPAAIAVANRGMNEARRKQDGAAVTQLTQQLAQLELAAGAPAAASPVAAPAAADRARPQPAAKSRPGTTPATKPAELVPSPADGPPPPDTLAAQLDLALRNGPAETALALLRQMAAGARARKDYAMAQKAYNDAIEIAHGYQLGPARAEQYASLGHLYAEMGNKIEAESYWRSARDQYEQFELPAKAAEMAALLRRSSSAAIVAPSKPAESGRRTTNVIPAQ